MDVRVCVWEKRVVLNRLALLGVRIRSVSVIALSVEPFCVKYYNDFKLLYYIYIYYNNFFFMHMCVYVWCLQKGT